ncbi:MAG: hypothetical protein GY711_05460 [bacterium]|nr:hypothetical protein [bacterium]
MWALLVALFLSASTFFVATLSSSSKKLADTNVGRTQAEHLSLAGLHHVTDIMYQMLRSESDLPTAGTVQVGQAQVTYELEYLAGPTVVVDGDGLQSYDTEYGLEASIVVNGVRDSVKQVVVARQVPLFQYAFFYENDMHFTNPAPMQINGPVHCNSGIYFSGRRLMQINTNALTAVDGAWMSGKFGDPSWLYGQQTTVDIRKWVDDPNDPFNPVEYGYLQPQRVLDGMGVTNTSGFDSAFTGYDSNTDGDYDDTGDWLPFGPGAVEEFGPPATYTGSGDGHTLRTGEHGVVRVESPPVESMDMFVPNADGGSHDYDAFLEQYVEVTPGTGTHDKGPYHDKADLAIIMHADGSWSAFTDTGANVTASIAAAVSIGQMYDARQADGSGASIDMAVIDLGALAATGHFPTGGILYTAAYGAGTGTDVKGFQLTNGDTLPGDVSIVSADSLYVQGDFNTVAKKSAAVMADAVNLLSNNWDGTKAPGVLPTAAETTYNMAVLTGDTEATATSANGGPHNLVRFHENWSGFNCFIVGSMVCPHHSTSATGQFRVGTDYYRPPVRNWSFDTAFSDISNLPPGTPKFISVENIVTW